MDTIFTKTSLTEFHKSIFGFKELTILQRRSFLSNKIVFLVFKNRRVFTKTHFRKSILGFRKGAALYSELQKANFRFQKQQSLYRNFLLGG
jgi:hypothetical protein